MLCLNSHACQGVVKRAWEIAVNTLKAKHWLFDPASVPKPQKRPHRLSVLLILLFCCKSDTPRSSTIAVGQPFTLMFMLILWSPLLHQEAYIRYYKVKSNHLLQKNNRKFKSECDVLIFQTLTTLTWWIHYASVNQRDHPQSRVTALLPTLELLSCAPCFSKVWLCAFMVNRPGALLDLSGIFLITPLSSHS